MRIGFCGARCIGKSTVAKKVVQELPHHFLGDNTAINVFRLLERRNLKSQELAEVMITAGLVRNYIGEFNIVASRTLFDVYFIYLNKINMFNRGEFFEKIIVPVYKRYPLDILFVGFLKEDSKLEWVTEDEAHKRGYNNVDELKKEIKNDNKLLGCNFRAYEILSNGLAKKVVLIPAPFDKETILGEIIKNGV